MGFLDGLTSDGVVEMKHTEYYNLMKEAAKAELLGNAVKAEVPGFYIQAMITGKKPEFLDELKAEEEDTGFHSEYEEITGAVVSIFEAWMKENGVESAAASLHRLIDTLAQNRIEELQTIRKNQEERDKYAREAFAKIVKNAEVMAKMPPIAVSVEIGRDKGGQTAGGPEKNKRPDRDYWSCGTCFHHRKGKDLPICGQCEDGSKYTPSDDEVQEAHERAEDDTEGQQDQEESEEPDNGND